MLDEDQALIVVAIVCTGRTYLRVRRLGCPESVLVPPDVLAPAGAPGLPY
jgi:hypothetical protein